MKKCLFQIASLIILSLSSEAQLQIKNSSFEAAWSGPTETVPPPPDWNNCICCLDTSIADLNPKNSTLVIFDNSNPLQPTNGNSYIGLGAWYAQAFPSGTYVNVGGEMCSSELECGLFYKGHKYKFSVKASALVNSGNNAAPQLLIYAGNSTCDTSQRIFRQVISHNDINGTSSSWKQYDTSFIAKDNWHSISLRCKHTSIDTSTTVSKNMSMVYLDQLSDFIPDTTYNSLHFPIVEVCNGSSIFLQSPYPLEDHQDWFAGDSLVGSGYGIYAQPSSPTIYTLVVHNGTFIPSVIQTLVYPSCENELAFPTAFTPNGDLENDVFRSIQNMDNHQIINYDLRIFNRWGNCIYEGHDIATGWNGDGFTIDTYFYMARYVAKNGKEKIKKGTVTLMR